MLRSRDNAQKKESIYIEIEPRIDDLSKHDLTGTKKLAYIKNKLQLQNHFSIFIHKNLSLLPATTLLYYSPMAYNTTASLDKLTCTDHVNFGKCTDGLGKLFWSEGIPTTWM